MKSLNYNMVPSYIQKDVWKSNAPPEVFFDIVKSWVRKFYSDVLFEFLRNYIKMGKTNIFIS